MDVGQNNLTGGVGLLLSNTPFLFEFHVDGNQLEGTIPDDFATVSLRVSKLLLSTRNCYHQCFQATLKPFMLVWLYRTSIFKATQSQAPSPLDLSTSKPSSPCALMTTSSGMRLASNASAADAAGWWTGSGKVFAGYQQMLLRHD